VVYTIAFTISAPDFVFCVFFLVVQRALGVCCRAANAAAQMSCILKGWQGSSLAQVSISEGYGRAALNNMEGLQDAHVIGNHPAEQSQIKKHSGVLHWLQSALKLRRHGTIATAKASEINPTSKADLPLGFDGDDKSAIESLPSTIRGEAQASSCTFGWAVSQASHGKLA
jgi:hypothetical protein